MGRFESRTRSGLTARRRQVLRSAEPLARRLRQGALAPCPASAETPRPSRNASQRLSAASRSKHSSGTLKVGVFGGSFDPIHEGHVAILEAAQKYYKFKWIYVVPAYRNPLKKIRAGSVRSRLEGLRRAVGRLPFVRVSLVEVRSGRPCYTVDTLRYFARRHPGAKLVWIAGSDIVTTFRRWKDPAGILKLAAVAVARRPGFRVTRIPRGFELFPMKPVAASSTRIRMRRGM